MTVDTSGPGAVLARMAAIQSQIAVITGAPGTATSSTTAGSAFDTVYADAMQGTDGTSGSAATTGATGASGAGSDLGDRLVASAKKYLGVPYVWGGESLKEGGLDCSGLIQLAFKDIGVDVPRLGRDQAKLGTAVPSLAQARPGDILAFNSPITHVAIYVGDGKMIAAPKRGDVVKIQDVYQTPSAIRRVGGSSAAGDVAGASAVSSSGSGGPQAYQALFAAATQRYGLPQGMLAAVARAESGFNPRAVSSAGAQGLMQLMPGTARGLGVDPMNPAQAIDGAARMLSRDLRKFGSTSLALAAYNAGAGAVQRYGGIPPYPETQQYVRRVLGYMGASS